jgi:hypothetical protein
LIRLGHCDNIANELKPKYPRLTGKGVIMMGKKDIILSEHFQAVGEVGPDERKRISLAKALEALKGLFGECEGLRFAVYFNEAGQILLSPKVSVPAHELWLYRNAAAFADVAKGLGQVGNRDKLKDLGSFEKYAEDDID